jgi:two-component system response regulator DesR
MGSATLVLRVLIVDDVEDVAEMLADSITELSPEPVYTFIGYDGREAVALAIEHAVNVAVLDIDMPVMNGIDAALAIRAAMPDCAPLLIALTGYLGNSLDERIGLAFDFVMRKPPDVDGLLKRISR